MSEQRSSGLALVSGANRGIRSGGGRQLAERGYEVLLSARDGEQAPPRRSSQTAPADPCGH
jgi:short-subunit dehydrogenase